MNSPLLCDRRDGCSTVDEIQHPRCAFHSPGGCPVVPPCLVCDVYATQLTEFLAPFNDFVADVPALGRTLALSDSSLSVYTRNTQYEDTQCMHPFKL